MGCLLMMIYASYSPLWLLFGGRAVLRTTVFWGGEDHVLGEDGRRGDTSSWGDPQAGVRMQTKGVKTENVSGTCVCQNLSILRIIGATEEKAAPERRLGCSPLSRAWGPSSLWLMKEGGDTKWTRLLATPRSGPRVLWVRPRPFPLLTLWCPAPRASPGAWEAPSLLPSPVPLPTAL